MPELIIKLSTYIYIFTVAAAFIYILGVALPSLIGEYFNLRQRKKFGEALKAAYNLNPPEWKHVEILSRRYLLDNHNLKSAIERLIEELITKNEVYNKEQVAYFDGLLFELKRIEPFEGIPDSLKIHLENVRNKIDDDKYDLTPLSNELRNLTTRRAKERKFDRTLAIAGLVVGIIGAVFGGIPYFFDSKPKGEIATIQTPYTSPDPNWLTPSKSNAESSGTFHSDQIQ